MAARKRSTSKSAASYTSNSSPVARGSPAALPVPTVGDIPMPTVGDVSPDRCDEVGTDRQRQIIAACFRGIEDAESALATARGALLELLVASRNSEDISEGCKPVELNSVEPVLASVACSPSIPFLGKSAAGTGGLAAPAIADGEECAREYGLVMMDQILLESRVETGLEEQEEEEGALRKSPDKDAHTKNMKEVNKCNTTMVLAIVGKNTQTGRNVSEYVARNQPYWSKACCRIRVPVWHPEAEFRLVWNMVGFVFIVFEAFLIPFYIAFSYEPTGFVFKVVSVVNTYFIIDVMLSFLTGFSEGGTPVLVSKRIVQRYVCTWFVFDVLSGIPWEWLPSQNNRTTMTKAFRFIKGLRLLRATRLLKMMKMGSLTDALEIIVESNRLFVFAVGVLRVLFLIFLVTHWLACAWFIVGSNPKEDVTWISKFLEGVDDYGTKYVYAMYFTLTTMTTVGYGDIAPQNETEVHFVLALELIAAVVFAGLMGALTDLVFNLNNEGNARAEKKAMLSRYMRWRALPKELFVSVREHLLFLWETNDSFDDYEDQIKDQLSPVLKKELSYHIYGRILNAAPFLGWMRDSEICLMELAQTVRSMFLSKGDYVFHVGSPNEHIFVLLRGVVYISQNQHLSLAPVKTNKGHERHDGGMTDFAIPRNKEAHAADVIKMFTQSVENRLHIRQKDSKDDKQKERMLDLMVGPTLGDLKKDEEEDAKEQQELRTETNASLNKKTQVETQDLLELHIDSSALHAAFKKLHRQDQREKRAAFYIQRRWRRNHGKVLAAADGHKRLSSARSKYVHAPAYLGESCLWDPLEEWDTDTAKPCPYAARCDSRGEFVYIARADVKDIIERFSPWLATRFEYFRQAVVDNIKKAEQGEENESGTMPPTPAARGQAGGICSEEAAHLPDCVEESREPVHKHRADSRSTDKFEHQISPGSGTASKSSLGAAMEQRRAERTYGRGGAGHTFRAAAATAIARVAARVTPPSANATPRAAVTPRRGTGGSSSALCATPRDNSVGRGTSNGQLNEPLLGSHGGRPAQLQVSAPVLEAPDRGQY